MHLLLIATLGFASLLPGLAGPTPTEAAALQAARHDTTAYTLPPQKLAQAKALHRIEETLTLSASIWTPLLLLASLSFGLASLYRNRAERLSSNRWAQAAAFVLLLLLTVELLELPFAIYGHHAALTYGLSVQGWISWLGDKGKALGLSWLLGTPLVVGVLAAIRRRPRQWWLWVWPPSVLVTLAGVLLTPYVIDPLFNRFEPLAQSDPALVAELQQVAQRSGIAIPPARMVLMRASDKQTGLNAYVTGFGPSKRIVVWDTTIAHSTAPEIAFVFAHELGHYALGHVITGVALSCFGLLPLFWLTGRLTQALLRKRGSAWRIRSMHDLAAVPALLLVASLLTTLSDPISNAISRRIEHNADVYGQEALHTILPEDRIHQVARSSFQTLGETSLEDPTPHPLFDLWFATHPPIEERAAFSEIYNPWTPGATPKYFPK